ncbi:MAG: pectate lyase-like adhesive domain-containing protein [Zhaonellaceae bacterium]
MNCIRLLFLQYLIDNRPASGYTAEDLRVIFKELVGLEEISIPKEFTVNSREELLSALELPEVEKITLASDLSTAEGIVIKRPIVILGNNKRIDFVGDVEGWQGNCIFTIYEVTDVVIADIKLTGADGAIFVHNSEVKLEGTINLSDNEFGGIKLGQITSDKTCLDVTEAQILTNEVYGVPALWKSYDDEEYIKGGNFNKILYGEKIHYYLSPKISPVTTIKAKNEADAIVAIDNQQNLIQKAKGKTFRDIRKALESTDWSKQTYQFLYSHGDKVTNEYDYAGNGSRLIVTSEDGSREAIYTITVNPIN